MTRLYKPDPAKTDPGTLTYGKHLSLMGILGGIAGNIDQVLLFHFVGPAQLATYNFAIAIPDQTKGPLKGLNTMVQAKFVNRSEEEIHTGMRNKILLLFVTSLSFVVLYIAAAPFVYHFLFPKYVDAALYSQIYVVSILAISLSPTGSYLVAKKKLRAQYIGNVIGSIFQIIAMTLGVIYWGLWGLIVARILTRFFNSFANFILYKITI